MKTSESVFPSRSPAGVRLLAVLILAMPLLASARLGETETECNRRYGTPKKTQEIVPGCPTNAYDYHGFRIRIAFLGFNGPALRMIFEKRPGPFLKDDEVAAILQANTPEGMDWKVRESELSRNTNPFSRLGAAVFTSGMGAKGWLRTDGATAELGLNRTPLTLSLPGAATLEQRAKAEAEAKRKAAIPAF